MEETASSTANKYVDNFKFDKTISKTYLCDLQSTQLEWLDKFFGGFRFEGETLNDILYSLKENSNMKYQVTESIIENKGSMLLIVNQIHDNNINSLKSVDIKNKKIVKVDEANSLRSEVGDDVLLQEKYKMIIKKEGKLMDEKKLLMEEKKLLMQKEEQLMQKEEQLIKKKKIIMNIQIPGKSYLAS